MLLLAFFVVATQLTKMEDSTSGGLDKIYDHIKTCRNTVEVNIFFRCRMKAETGQAETFHNGRTR